MIRIRTNLNDKSYVYTLIFNGKWITYLTFNGANAGSFEANTFLEAGQNHLRGATDIAGALGLLKSVNPNYQLVGTHG